MRIALNGALGRMGRMVQEAAAEAGDEVVALVERPDHPQVGRVVQTPWGDREVLADPSQVPADVDAAIDFSAPDAAVAFVEALAPRGVPIVSGTTGLADAHLDRIRSAACQAPVLWTANTSLGVFCLHEVCALARRILGPAYDVEIVEVHHRHKRDAPSGTALSLARRLTEDTGERVVAGRQGDLGPRTGAEVGVLAVRGGEVVGEHTVLFLGTHDRIEVTHRAASRRLFADGAVALARRLAGRGPGLYGVHDVFRTAALGDGAR